MQVGFVAGLGGKSLWCDRELIMNRLLRLLLLALLPYSDTPIMRLDVACKLWHSEDEE